MSIHSYQRMYDRMAPFYAGAMRLLPMWRRYTQAVLPWLEQVPDRRALLEIGPGPGVLLGQLAHRFQVAVGVDLSLGMLYQAQQRLTRNRVLAYLVEGNATDLPFASDSFDAVVLTFTFSAIPNGPAAMNEIARVLTPGGLVTLVDAGVPDDGNAIGVGLARLWELFDDFMREEADLMRQAGLEVLERRQFGAFDGIRLVVGRKG